MRPKLLLSLASLLLAAASLSAAELVERIVARVNDRLITQSEFDKRAAVMLKPARNAAEAAENRKNLLEDMIRERLLEERAKEMSVSATDEEIDAAVQKVKSQYNISSDPEFDQALAQSGMTRDDLRRQMKETITLQKVVGREVASKLELNDDLLRTEYERQKEKVYAIPESAHVAEIVLRFPANDPEARQQAVTRIEEIRSRVKTGTPFGDVAKELSQGNTKERGGELGTVAKGELVEAFDQAIFATNEEYPAPALTSDSVRIFHVTDRKQAGYKPFAEVKEDLRKRISDDLYEKRFGEYMDHLRHEAYVKIYDAELAKLVEQAAKKEEKK